MIKMQMPKSFEHFPPKADPPLAENLEFRKLFGNRFEFRYSSFEFPVRSTSGTALHRVGVFKPEKLLSPVVRSCSSAEANLSRVGGPHDFTLARFFPPKRGQNTETLS